MTYRNKYEGGGTIVLYRGRTEVIQQEIRQFDKTTKYQIPASAHVRFKVWSTDEDAPELDIDSVGPTASGSRVTIDARGNGSSIDARVTVKIAQGDVTMAASSEDLTYQWELSVVDTDDSNLIKVANRGTCEVRGSATGDVGVV